MYKTKLCAVALILFASFITVGYAATVSPKSGAGGLPHQAPLQALPQGVGANISNNIQQTENSGPPASSTTVTPVEDSAAESGGEAIGAKTSQAESVSSTQKSEFTGIIFWVLAVACIAVFVTWLWHVTNKRVS